MEVKFYSFKKKDNSTARPSGGISLQVRLKSDSSVINPLIECSTQDKPFKYNYAYIPDYDRYYFVADWTWITGFWEASLVVDALASWKDTIGSTPMYVLRSSAAFDGAIGDDMYPTKAAPKMEFYIPNAVEGETWLPLKRDFKDGYFIVGVVTSGENTQGAVSYYSLGYNGMQSLMNYLMSDTGYLDVPTDISVNGIPDNLLKTLYNPFQYIVSCKWFPLSIVGSLKKIRYGWWETSVYGLLPTDPKRTLKGYVDIPPHPQSVRGQYLNGAPYTKISIYIEPFGLIPIDTSRLADFTTTTRINFTCIIDYVTGGAILTINTANGMFERTVNAQIGVDIQLAQMAVDKLSQTETIIAGAAETTRDAFSIKAAINPISGAAGAVSTATHAIADGIRASFPQTQISGANGSTIYTQPLQHVIVERYMLVDEDNEHNGRPYCKIATPASLGGYMSIRDADVATTGTAEEDTRIRAYLESGFYYE